MLLLLSRIETVVRGVTEDEGPSPVRMKDVTGKTELVTTQKAKEVSVTVYVIPTAIFSLNLPTLPPTQEPVIMRTDNVAEVASS